MHTSLIWSYYKRTWPNLWTLKNKYIKLVLRWMHHHHHHRHHGKVRLFVCFQAVTLQCVLPTPYDVRTYVRGWYWEDRLKTALKLKDIPVSFILTKSSQILLLDKGSGSKILRDNDHRGFVCGCPVQGWIHESFLIGSDYIVSWCGSVVSHGDTMGHQRCPLSTRDTGCP